MTDAFLSSGDNLDEFLEAYHEKRKLAHLRRVKVTIVIVSLSYSTMRKVSSLISDESRWGAPSSYRHFVEVSVKYHKKRVKVIINIVLLLKNYKDVHPPQMGRLGLFELFLFVYHIFIIFAILVQHLVAGGQTERADPGSKPTTTRPGNSFKSSSTSARSTLKEHPPSLHISYVGFWQDNVWISSSTT